MSTDQLKIEVGELLKSSPDGTDNTLPKGPIGDWDVSTLTDMSDLFSGADKFNADISKWDVSRVTKMSRMFLGASSFDGDLSKWDVSRVTDMTSMFEGAKNF